MKLWVLGGDRRQGKLAELFDEDGHYTHVFALDQAELRLDVEEMDDLEGIDRADCVVLPLPVTRDGVRLNTPLSDREVLVSQVFAALEPGQRVVGGMVPPTLQKLARERGVVLVDYFTREELAVANAVPAA